MVTNPLKKLHQLITNKASPERVMVQCSTVVRRNAVRRETIDGVEHIVVSSYTLPNDIVMNGGLYPADEITKSYQSLERTLAPIEHPKQNDRFISASDPHAIHNFHAGAFNMNVRQENGRVYMDKYINVVEANKSERGRRLLDRIEELETNENPRAIHTSTGVFVTPEALAEPRTNEAGQEYSWIARNMMFDHDAILLDSVAAAQPNQGVGMAVNADGKEISVMAVNLDQNDDPSDEEKTKVKGIINSYLSKIRTNEHSLTVRRDSVDDALQKSAISADYIEELFEGRVIFWSGDQLFEVPYTVDEQGLTTIVGIPLPVERNVAYIPKTNSEVDTMKELIINALAAAGIDTDNMSDEQLLSKYKEITANANAQPPVTDPAPAADVTTNAVLEALKPMTDRLNSIEKALNANNEAELTRLATLVSNHVESLDVESAKKLGVDKLKEMSANFNSSFGISPVVNTGGDTKAYAAPSEMPE